MRRILLHKNVTTTDIDKLADKKIYTAEFEYYTECQRKRFEYSALCKNTADITTVENLNIEISERNHS